jgi:hypothetical protein
MLWKTLTVQYGQTVAMPAFPTAFTPQQQQTLVLAQNLKRKEMALDLSATRDRSKDRKAAPVEASNYNPAVSLNPVARMKARPVQADIHARQEIDGRQRESWSTLLTAKDALAAVYVRFLRPRRRAHTRFAFDDANKGRAGQWEIERYRRGHNALLEKRRRIQTGMRSMSR